MSFQSKTILVTGATSGIGRTAAERFGREGATVLVSGRDRTRGDEVVRAIESAGGTARFIAADLGAETGAADLAAAAGDVDILVNNAGTFPFGPTHEITAEQIREVLNVNVASPFILTGVLAPKMVARGGGVIINVSTMVASVGAAGMGAYGSSKAAINLLTKSWADEYGPQQVRVNAVAPGPTRTPGTEPMGPALDELASTLPLGRPAEAEEIASAIVYLASDEASYINGAILAVDGGRTAV